MYHIRCMTTTQGRRDLEMPQVRIVTDSACDIDPHYLESIGVSVVPLTVRFGE